ncbi:response regulator [Pedobacter sp. KBS0701]|uniref:phosphorylase family protein n=1 Tax=Pedobacter sp. KBS0701 TaxID=2578106 RepID=UPI00110D8280|nr:response regulator [Pedobacter sp. KBS0701]QDW25253.1 response regulator [Pedobacter sp. KBS0701]
MFKILIVEDEPQKIKSVYRLLEKVIELDTDNDVIDVMDSNEAKKLMKTAHFDMLILDIAIPLKKSGELDPLGGVKLLDEILQRESIYKIPTHIIGLSAKSDSFEAANEKFGKDTLTIIKYEQNSDDWETSLLSGIQHRVTSKQKQQYTQQNYSYDAAIICALGEELKANLENGWSWKIIDALSHDDTIYHEATVPGNPAKKVIAAHAMRMGIPATTTLATKMVYDFRPRVMIMTGIMAGVSSKTNLGDTILGNPIWDWGSGKWTTEINDNAKISSSVFQIEPFQYKPDTRTVKYSSLIEMDKNFFFEIRNRFKGTKPDYDIKLLAGPIASGASVLANKSKFNEILEQNRKLLGIEMEGYGLMCAADSVAAPKPTALCIKTVVDFGDKGKSDDFHDFGCYASAMIAKKILEDHFFKENK